MRVLLSVLLLFCFAAGPAHAAGPDLAAAAPFSLSPAELLAAAEGPVPEDNPGVEILLHSVRYEIDAAHRVKTHDVMVYRVLSEDGAENWSQLAQRWRPWHQKAPSLRARVVTKDGRAHELDPATLADAPVQQDFEVLDDSRFTRTPLPAVAVGAVIETEVVLEDEQPFFIAGVHNSFHLEGDTPLRQLRVVLDAPAESSLRWQAHGEFPAQPIVDNSGGRQRLIFAAANPETKSPWWPHLPPEVPWGHGLQFATGASWADIARAYAAVVEGQLRELGDLDTLAGPRTKKPVTDAELAALLDRVHREVRYTAVELGEASLVPRSPAETLKRRFGDCKDKAVLVVALLRRLGVPAHVALLRAGSGTDVAPGLPGMGVFNHAIVYVPERGKGQPALWIDATDPFTPLGELPLLDQGRQALIARNDTRALSLLPVAAAQVNHLVEVREVFLPSYGKGRLIETSEYGGWKGSEYRGAWFGKAVEEQEELVSGYVERTFVGAKLERHEISDPRDLSRPLRFRIEAKELGSALTDRGEAAVGIPVKQVLQHLPSWFLDFDEEAAEQDAGEEDGEDDEPRTADFLLPAAHVAELRYLVNLPPSLVLRELPTSRVDDFGPAKLHHEFRHEGGRVEANYRFVLERRRLTVTEAEALRQKLSAVEGVVLHFDQLIPALVSQGKIAEALREADRQIALGGAEVEATARSQRAGALLAAGLGEAARREAQRAVELAPSYPSYVQLGLALEHDAMGQPSRPGWDMAGAKAALEKALDLGLEAEVGALAELAILSEHDEQGQRYQSVEGMEKALGLWAQVAKKGHQEFEDSRIVTLSRLGRWQEIKDLTAKLPVTNTRLAYGAAAIAVLEKPSKAVSYVARQVGEPLSRSQTLAGAGFQLAAAKQWAAAAELIEAATPASKVAGVLGKIAALYRRRAAPPGADAATPEDLFARMLQALLEPTPTPTLALMPRSVRERPWGERDQAEFEKHRRRFVQNGASQPFPPPIMFDFALGALNLRVEAQEGNDQLVRSGLPLGQVPGGTESCGGPTPARGAQKERGVRGGGGPGGARRVLDWARARLGDHRTSDPLSPNPFGVLWPAGGDPAATVERLQLVAALAACQAEEYVHPLDLAAVITHRDLARTPAERAAVARGLADAYRQDEQWEKLEPEARLLVELEPSSKIARQTLGSALAGQRRWQELHDLGQTVLAADANSFEGIRMLRESLAHLGDLAASNRWLEREMAHPDADSFAFNRAAWSGLYGSDKELLAAIELARRAVALGERDAPLHTLATALAAAGRAQEALATLVKAIDARPVRTIEPHDWLVLGRIAQNYGLKEEARELYQRVTPPGPEDYSSPGSSAYDLAQKWLRQVG